MADTRQKAVFLTSECPYPATSGAKLRDSQLIQLLAERMELEVLCFSDRTTSPDRINDGQSVVGGAHGTPIYRIRRERAPLWKRATYPFRPYIVNHFSRAMADALRKRAQPGKVLWVSRLGMAQYIPLARAMGYRVILDEHHVESKIWMNAAFSSMRSWPETLLAAQCAWYEQRFCSASDAVVATSDIDASRLHKLAPRAHLHVIPSSVDSPSYVSARGQPGNTLFFSGTLSFERNIEGLEWFIAEILPRLRAAMGADLPRIVIAGEKGSKSTLRMLENAGAEVHSNPRSMIPLLGEAAVVFVPIRSGGALRLKILEAMAAGRPVVSTGRGAEGLVLAPGHDIFIADQEDAFTSAVLRLLREPALREMIGKNAIKTVETSYDWRCARPLLESLLSSLNPTTLKE